MAPPWRRSSFSLQNGHVSDECTRGGLGERDGPVPEARAWTLAANSPVSAVLDALPW